LEPTSTAIALQRTARQHPVANDGRADRHPAHRRRTERDRDHVRELDLSSQLFEITKRLLVPAASLDDVIRMKEAADRVKDHLALPELRRLRGHAHPERSRDIDPFPGLEAIITMQCGPVRHEIALAETAAAALGRRLHVHDTQSTAGAGEIPAIQDVFRALVQDEARTRQIATDVTLAVRDGRNVLVLTQWTDHLDALAVGLHDRGLEPLVLKAASGRKHGPS
jgi:hypothetical protein